MKTLLKILLFVSTLCILLIGSHSAMAGVSAKEAEKLKTTLTPLGAEKAGNAEGTIPAWDGGLTTPAPGFVNGGKRPDLFPDEKPLFSITAQNMDQHADKLTDGVKALLQKYPETYRVDVYKTHRTAAAPQWVYDNTFKNATQGKLEGLIPKNVYGGIPFPIPKSGAEVMWNHELMWRGVSVYINMSSYLVTANGKRVNMAQAVNKTQMPYYFQNGSLEDFNGNFYSIRNKNSGPAIRRDEGILANANFDTRKSQVYVYLPGQRRVRKLPDACCDSPTAFSSGLTSFDEVNAFTGGTLSLERFDWKIIDKKEIYIPYNANKLFEPTVDELFGDHHFNPDYVRWELHRVWVVEANLREGSRHTSPKSIYYIDEDTWGVQFADRWDADGQLWRMVFNTSFAAPDIPATRSGTWGYYDLLGSAYYATPILNDQDVHFKTVPPYPDRAFSPAALAGEGIR